MKNKLNFMQEVRRAVRREMPPPSQVHSDKRRSKKRYQKDKKEMYNE